MLRQDVIRLAFTRPDLRAPLLSVVTAASYQDYVSR